MKIDIQKIKKEKSTEELLKFGIINVDKPSGPTSFSVSQFVKKVFGLNKTSHMGTLDPMVTGVLPVALGRACRLSEYLMHRNKIYVGIMRMHKEIGKKELENVIAQFIGKIMQLPPVRSRVKRAVREREIVSFKILEIEGKDVLFETEVQAGTYIRKLCDDIGKELGGAHMLELRRTRAGFFDESTLVDLYNFEKAIEEYKKGSDTNIRNMVFPAEIIANILPVIFIRKDVVKKCLTGSPIFDSFIEGNIPEGMIEHDKLAIFCNERFIGCYKFINKNTIIALPEFVFN